MKQLLSLVVAVTAISGAAGAQEQENPPPADDPTTVEQQAFPYGPPPIPPNVEETAVAGPGGSYCYNGPHPVDTRVAGGSAWDDSGGYHTHFYPPIDLRLFAFRDGCYTFTGDPVDFGYRGQVYSYYGAHPMLDSYGGGWCFMIGAHAHAFRPWSSSFVVVGPWYYWQGAYDATFWSYWPYYSYYYRSYYPHYYSGGRFYRNRDMRVAPPIRHVPPGAYSGGAYGGRGGYAPSGGYGGGGNNWRGTPAPGRPVAPGNQWHAPPATVGPSNSWRPTAPTPAPAPRAAPPAGGWTGTPTRITPAPARSSGSTFHPPVKSGVRR